FARHQMMKNSWYVLLKDFQVTTLLRTLPRFLFAQLVLLAAAMRNGAALTAFGAYAAVVANLPGVLRDRRAIQRGRVLSGADVTGWLTDQWPMDVGVLGRIFERVPGV